MAIETEKEFQHEMMIHRLDGFLAAVMWRAVSGLWNDECRNMMHGAILVMPDGLECDILIQLANWWFGSRYTLKEPPFKD